MREWSLYSYSIPLKTGVERKGLLLCIDQHWGEIAPLEGRSSETLAEAQEQLMRVLQNKMPEILLPSVQWGIECALTPITSPLKASLYGLVTGKEDEILHQSKRAKSEGYTTLKIKISNLSVSKAQHIIRTLKEHFRLRIDCNSAFSYQEAIQIFSPFESNCFDYIEDPTYEIEHLSQFPYPFALDETASQFQSLPLHTFTHLYGFILKPTILGGTKGCAPLIDYAKKHHLNTVFSPCFETGVGLSHILRLNQNDECIGLDTHRFLSFDVLDPPCCFSAPHCTLNPPLTVALQSLTEIAHGTTTLSHCNIC